MVKAVADDDLPVHFFTIVLNGAPFIRYHLELFRQLPFRWHWHVIEGVANLAHDTAWSLHNGGRIDPSLHDQGRSIDGTSDYLDAIAATEPERVSLYRKPPGAFWDGKLEMVAAPLPSITEECLLWQVDADELWTAAQIAEARQLFLRNPGHTAAYFLCHFFVGRDRVSGGIDAYGNNRSFEWLRLWRFRPGDGWSSHEPPSLCRGRQDLGTQQPFIHEETAAAGLVFQHYAYATEAQAAFKEIYYGYQGAVDNWRGLQGAVLPCRLADHFPWVKDDAVVERIEHQRVRPLALCDDRHDGWRFDRAPRPLDAAPARALLARASVAPRRSAIDVTIDCGAPLSHETIRHVAVFRLDNIGDMVMTTGFLRELRKLSPAARITVFCGESSTGLLSSCPYINQIVAIPQNIGILPSDPRVQSLLESVRRSFSGAFDLVVNPRFAEDYYCANLLMQATGAPLRLGYQQPTLYGSYDPNSYLTHQLLYSRDDHPALTAVACLRVFTTAILDPRLEVWSNPDGAAKAAAMLTEQPYGRPLCAVGISASQAYRCWPIENYAELCRRLWTVHGIATVLVGGKGDQAAAQVIVEASGAGCANACGRLDLGGLVALFGHCHAFVGNDSGPKHIAAVAGLPVVEVNWVPLGGEHGGTRGGLTKVPVFGEAVTVSPNRSFDTDSILSGSSIASVTVEAVEAEVVHLMTRLFS